MRTDPDAQAMQAALEELQWAYDSLRAEPSFSKAIATLRERLADFNPDWDKLAATQDSLREHMAEVRALRERLAQPDTLPHANIHAKFEVVCAGATDSTDAPVKRVEVNGDGSCTVVIDHWPGSRTSDRGAIRDAAIEQCAAKLESSVDLSGLSSDPALMKYTAEMAKCCAEVIRALKGEGK